MTFDRTNKKNLDSRSEHLVLLGLYIHILQTCFLGITAPLFTKTLCEEEKKQHTTKKSQTKKQKQKSQMQRKRFWEL
jgi:hypothetical protein